MKPNIRKLYNEAFTDAKYQTYIDFIETIQGGPLQFRLAETPLFLDKTFTQSLLDAGNAICQQLTDPSLIEQTSKAIPSHAITKNETTLPQCLVLDFAIAHNKEQQIIPTLIELQGFPSLFGFEIIHDQAFQTIFPTPLGFSPYLNTYNKERYIEHFKKIVLGNNHRHTILLEIHPEEQKTKIDFYCTRDLIGIPIICITEVFQKEGKLYYHKDGEAISIGRIYNRMVFEEIQQQDKNILDKWDLIRNTEDVEWVTHPHHFFRFSKFSMPFLKGTAVPSTQFLHLVKELPKDLDQYILKPLFSFAGQGVIIDLTEEIISEIEDPENWILQEKVIYAPVIETPTGPTKAEIRLFYFWDDQKQAFVATMNLARLSKGKMIGVNYNKTATWVGGSLAYVES